MPSFDLNTYAVTPGTHSLEASAGTGKTFSLVGLILRQVVENDLRLPRVLAVTFTKKATGELAERLRQKLAEAASLLAETNAGACDDPQLAHWQRQVSGNDALRLRYLTRIRTALAESDNASVFTIHGFCQRVLSECAFESGLAFDLDMEDAGAAFTRTAVRDFIRELYRPLALDTPHADAARFIHDDLDIDESWLTELARHLASGGKVEWSPLSPTYGARVAGGAALTAFFAERNQALAAFAANKTTEMDELLDAIGRLSALIPDEAADSNRKPAVASLKDFVALAFAARLEAKLDAVKSAAGVLTFDDLIRKTAEALANPEVGEALAARLRERYAIGLIDEFQDTDALQIDIFQKIFAGVPLLFIGDPKQSIYRFRGADVSAYANAVASVPQENRCLLDTNFRSTAPMIHAANALFASDKGSKKDGLFMKGETDLFIPVNPSTKRIPPVTDASGSALTALTLVWLEGQDGRPVTTKRAESRFANDLAARIRELLNGHSLGARELLASDIAVLVRSGKQGALVQAALRAAGVPASRVSGSVFADDAAGALRRLLAAFLAPRRPAVLRAALAGPIVGLDAEGIRKLDTHEEDYRDWADAFADAAEVWKRSGIAAALTGFLNGKALPERMLARADGERLMADLRQLIEFAHAEELAGHHAPESLLGWLDAQIHASGETVASDANRQRLESDGDCVTIMTMHAAKGLEFPVVFVPFAWKFSQDNRKAFVSGDLGGTRAVAVSGNHEDLEATEDSELYAEQARLLYVAVTRAKSACFLYTGLLADSRLTNSIGDTPLGMLGPLSGKGILKPAGKTTKEKILPCSTRVDWEIFAQGELLNKKAPGCVRVVDCAKRAVVPATPSSAPAAKSAPPAATIAPRELRIAIDRQRISASYSGIAATLGHAELAPRAESEETSHRHDERRVAASPDFAQPSGDSDSIHTFPRGATVGDAVHEFLEEHDFAVPAEATAVSRALRCNGLDAERWTPVLRERIDAWMATPLTDREGRSFALRDIAAGDRLPEMGFDLRARLASGAAVADALSVSTSAAMLAPTIAALRNARPVNLDGYLTGFIDLIFRRDGRYYILDWKTNHLGPSLDDYGRPSLERAMAEHHYHLQYHFYLVAIDAHLRASLPDYAPETHLGGVFYLFVRGLDPDRPGNGVFRADAEPQVIRALAEALDNTAAIHRTTEI